MPMTVQRVIVATCAAWRAAVASCHVRLCARFIEEHELLGFDEPTRDTEVMAFACYVFALLLGRVDRLFLNVMPNRLSVR